MGLMELMKAPDTIFDGLARVECAMEPLIPHPHITIDADSGVAYVERSRVPVRRIFDWWRRGVSMDTLIGRYPQLGPASVMSAVAFALDNPEWMAKEPKP